MTIRCTIRAAGVLMSLAIGSAIVVGQVFEDRMEPEEIGLRDIDALVVPPDTYVGNEVCETCHAAAYRKWLETAHSRAFVPMRSAMAMRIGEMAGITACCPAKSGKCLPCHGTAHNVPAAYRKPSFRMGEGVSCEKCHGPGASHAAAMLEGNPGPTPGMRRPTEEDCRGCHDPKPSHDMRCENCHEQRARHVAAMRGSGPGVPAIQTVSTPPSVEECRACHSTRPSHAVLLGARHYSIEEAWKAIAHPTSPDP